MSTAKSRKEDQQNNVIERVERITQVGHWTLDIETNKLFWSEQAYEIHGLSPDMYTPDITSAINAYVEEDRNYVSKCVKNAIENGENFVFECHIKRVDGEIRSVIGRGECEKNEDGQTTRIFGTLQDITQIKLEQERYEMAIHASNTAIWDWNIETDEVEWHGASAKVLGFASNHDLPPTTLEFYDKLLHEDSQAIIKEAFIKHFKSNLPLNEELKFKKNDQIVWMLARGQAQKNSQGRAVRFLGSLTDISKLKEAEDKLKRSNNDLDQFASIAAHDLQGPLRVISGFLELLREKYKDKLDKQAQEYINLSIDGAENMSELIADLLEYSRLETDGMNIEETDITKTIQRTMRQLMAAINETDAKISFENLPKVSCDPLKIQRIFYNLIENALKYKPKNKKPEITINATEKTEHWHFVVEDNGIGIKKEKLNDIFLMFNRLHKKTEFKGTGIGLAICKKVIDLHNGEIWAESNYGHGTQFHFTLPKAIQKTSNKKST